MYLWDGETKPDSKPDIDIDALLRLRKMKSKGE